MIIGIAGVAGAGKDSFFLALQEALLNKRNVIRFSLADKLKEEVSEFCIKKYNIDPRTCSREDKEKIRHVLVKYARDKRLASQGRYWLNQIEDEVLKYKSSETIAVITDIRYSDYERDEIFWLKHEIKGTLVHLSRFEEDENKFKYYRRGANEEELRNEPVLYEEADYSIEWPETEEGERKKMMIEHANKFLKWYKKHIDKT